VPAGGLGLTGPGAEAAARGLGASGAGASIPAPPMPTAGPGPAPRYGYLPLAAPGTPWRTRLLSLAGIVVIVMLTAAVLAFGFYQTGRLVNHTFRNLIGGSPTPTVSAPEQRH
jgi:hypothetical protein